MTGDATPLLTLLVLVSTAAYAVLGLVFAASSFGSERVLFGSGERGGEAPTPTLRERAAGGRRPDAATVGVFVGLVAVFFFLGGIQLQIRLGEAGLLASEWLLLFLPATLFVRAGGFDMARTLSLRAPTAPALLGGLLLIVGAIPNVWVISWLQSFVLPIPWELLEGLQDLVTAESVGRFVWLLVLLAVTPAICEEVVFRGVFLAGTAHLKPRTFLLLNGVVFGLFHLSFETVIRFLPTATLGILIAWAVWRSGSIFVGMMMHLVNNGTIVTLSAIPALQPMLADPEAPMPVWLLWLAPAGFLIAAAGARILLAEPRHDRTDIDIDTEPEPIPA